MKLAQFNASWILCASAIFMCAIEAEAMNAECIFSDTECACSRTMTQGTCLRYTSGPMGNAQCATESCNGGGFVCDCDGNDICSVEDCDGWKMVDPNAIMAPIGTQGVKCVYSSGSRCLTKTGVVTQRTPATTAAPLVSTSPATTASTTTTTAPATTEAAAPTATSPSTTTTAAPATTAAPITTKAPSTTPAPTTPAPVTTTATTTVASTYPLSTTTQAPATTATTAITTEAATTILPGPLSRIRFRCDYAAHLYVQGKWVAEAKGWRVVSEWVGALAKGDTVAVLGLNGQVLAGCEVDITWYDTDTIAVRTVSTFNDSAWRASCDNPRTAVTSMDGEQCAWNNAILGQCDDAQVVPQADCIWAAGCSAPFSEIAIKTVMGNENAGC